MRTRMVHFLEGAKYEADLRGVLTMTDGASYGEPNVHKCLIYRDPITDRRINTFLTRHIIQSI